MIIAVHIESGTAHYNDNGRNTAIGHIVKYEKDLLILHNSGEHIVYSVEQKASDPENIYDYYMVNITSRVVF